MVNFTLPYAFNTHGEWFPLELCNGNNLKGFPYRWLQKFEDMFICFDVMPLFCGCTEQYKW